MQVQITLLDLFDIALVAALYYRLIILVRGTRAASAIHGLVLILVIAYVSGELGLHTTNWLLTNFLSSFFVILVILFQADFRKALAALDYKRFLPGAVRSTQADVLVHNLVMAVFAMAHKRMGALIVLEMNVPLGDLMARGVELSSPITYEVLGTIFNTQAPLHDGAVLVRGDRIAAAACVLPLSAAQRLEESLGTRHRAALGLAEETDALVLVVSEEKGTVRLALDGRLSDPLSERELRIMLLESWGKRL